MNPNLIPVTMRTKEEARELSRKGGRNSGRARRNQRTFREALKILCSSRIEKGTPLHKKAVAMMKSLGIKGDPTGQDLINLGVFNKAMKGDTNAAEFIRDTIGEKPTETFEDITPQSPIILGMIPQEEIDAAKAKRSARNKQTR